MMIYYNLDDTAIKYWSRVGITILNYILFIRYKFFVNYYIVLIYYVESLTFY